MTDADNYNESKFMRKAKENPFVPVGMAGFFAIVGYRLYKMKSRGDTKMSVHLIHMRVMAQGFVVGAMTIGMDLFVHYHPIWKCIMTLLFHNNYLTGLFYRLTPRLLFFPMQFVNDHR
uniref:HIG1 domain-containing protein n=1 Tax=Gadus morhua TaxID=8049 RepID=A0A8C5BDV5_GADMO